jgi:hypothetical protein
MAGKLQPEPDGSAVLQSALDAFNRRPEAQEMAGYFALLDLFDRHVRPNLNDSTIRAGAFAAYGWMPVILNRVEPSKVTSRESLVQALIGSKTAGDAHDVLASAADEDRDALLTSVNASVVGTSKFLHFLIPNAIPIWDSHVARCFGLTKRNEYNRSDRYVAYLAALGAIEGDALPGPVQNYWRNQGTASPVRMIEFAAHTYGKSLRSGADSAQH